MKTLILSLLLTASAFAQTYEPFWAMYEKPTIAEKKEVFFTLSVDEQNEARRMNIAWAVGKLNPNAEQMEFLNRYIAALPTMSPAVRDALRDEAFELFPKGGDLLFGTMGPYAECSVFVRPNFSPFQPTNCPCSVGSKFNMSCDDSCTTAAGRCNTTSGGCGFGWLYGCDGFCLVSFAPFPSGAFHLALGPVPRRRRSGPDSMSRDELALKASVSRLSSGFEKNLSTMRSLGLIDYGPNRTVYATKLLFPFAS